VLARTGAEAAPADLGRRLRGGGDPARSALWRRCKRDQRSGRLAQITPCEGLRCQRGQGLRRTGHHPLRKLELWKIFIQGFDCPFFEHRAEHSAHAMKGAVQSRQRFQNQTQQRRDLGHQDETVPMSTDILDRTVVSAGGFSQKRRTSNSRGSWLSIGAPSSNKPPERAGSPECLG
jgi:hypothetical protein